MSRNSAFVRSDIAKYVTDVSLRESEVLAKLRRETESHELARMQIAAEQGQLMALIVRMLRARKTLEIGVFTGYSSLAVALALPEDGRLVALDNSEEFTAVARRYWRDAKVDHKIDLRLGDALESLDQLIEDGQVGSFDFAFIDADKTGMRSYYERCLNLVRPRGVIAVDNVLWGGTVLDADTEDRDTRAIQQFNEALRTDERIDLAMLPIADGLTLAVKR